MLDFVGFINDNWNATTEKKLLMLHDFCAQYGYEEYILDPETGGEIPNPESRVEFANRRITQYIVETVTAYRKIEAEKLAIYEELELR
jgi:hypothetical protein